MAVSFLRRITPRQWTLFAGALVAFAGLVYLYQLIDVQALHDRAQHMNGLVVFVVITVLPMFGFPVSVLHVVAGVRFGTGLGIALTTVSIFIQLLASYALVKAAPDFFARWVEPLRKRLPEAAHTPLTQFTMLLPGAPYFAQNYVLPLVGVPLGTYLLWSFPLHVVRSIVGVIFGDESAHLTPGKLVGFGIYSIAIGLTCAWSFRRLQRKMKDPPAAAGDPTPLA
ncbi:MAG: associated Golgi protein [Rariglobus sp.]|jgi:uncharacterized membrane protein YdjX (TVP38/TMEM64 family)|nr:associated Golgi protein [Rariglobus sp.]